MTLPLRKKRPITAQTLSRAIRTSTAILLASLPALAVGQQWQGDTALRPVPRFGAASQPPRTDSRPSTRSTLQWRQSRTISTSDSPTMPRPNGGIERAVQASPSAQVNQNLQPAGVPPRLDHVHPVNWQAPQTNQNQGETLIPPPALNDTPELNFFDDPFGDDPIPGQDPEPSNPPAPIPNEQPNRNPGPSNRSSAGPGEQLIPPPGRSTPDEMSPPNDLRFPPSELEEAPAPSGAQREPLRAEPPAVVPPTPQPEPDPIPTPTPEPEFNLPAPQAEPGLGDRIRSEPPRPKRSTGELPPPRDDSAAPELPENPFNDMRDSPSDRQLDEIDRDKINSNLERNENQGLGLSLSDDSVKIPAATLCNDFRQRIAEQTIDQVSLDISPPYRPDEINLEKYEQLKADFDEKQSIRDWRNYDGTRIATGRLRNLAYEKAVIEIAPGTMEELQLNRLSEADLAYIAENWGLPPECLLHHRPAVPRDWAMTTMTWKASNICYTPLYFQDANLERYGHTHGPLLEPLVQSAHFFGNVLVLPYKMGVHSPHECQYPLGYYRPGNCAPWIKPPVPISAKGALTQAVTMSGLFWLIP